MMVKQQKRIESVAHIAKIYHLGIVCPAEAWRMISDAVAGEDIDQLFESLNQQEEGLIIQIYKDRPNSLLSLSEPPSNATFLSLLEWCTRDQQIDT